MRDAKISARAAIIAVCLALLGGFLLGAGIYAAGPDRAERDRVEELSARNADLEQRLVDNNRRARELVDGMADSLERHLRTATDTAELVGALREVLTGLQDYYNSIGDDYSDSDSDGDTGGGT